MKRSTHLIALGFAANLAASTVSATCEQFTGIKQTGDAIEFFVVPEQRFPGATVVALDFDQNVMNL